MSWLKLLILVLLLAGCSKDEKPFSLTDAFPGADAFPGWTLAGEGEVRLFDRENLYDLVNGQADAFFVYGFEQVGLQDYENGKGVMLSVEVWQLGTPADAYGLFSASISGAPVALGNDGDGEPGRRLAFWQDRYYVRVRARQSLPDAELQGFAGAVSEALPSGGERPALVDRLPDKGLLERSVVFFHQEISIYDRLWLGGENLLGLGPETDGVLANYDDVGGVGAQLLLVQYPDAEAASAGLAALESGGVDGLLTADVRNDVLGVVLGRADVAAASALLAAALDNE